MTQLYTAFAAFAASLAMIAPAHAQDAAPQASGEAAKESDEIVVLATPDASVRIDRRVYTLRDDAEAQSTDMFEVLGHVPSVIVSPDGDVSLLGASNVTVQINGQTVPGQSLEAVLRGLPGSQVKRIEILSNPPAQFSAGASGGIINIITRDRFIAGLSGLARVGADTFGGATYAIAPSWSGEKLTLSGWAGLHGYGEERAAYGQRNELPAGPDYLKRGVNGFDYDGWYATGNAGYRPNARRRYTASLSANAFDYRFHEYMNWTSSSAPGSLRTVANHTVTDNTELALEMQQDGAVAEDLTKAKLVLTSDVKTYSSLIGAQPTGAATSNRYLSTQDTDTETLNFTFDAERPRPQDRFFTWGAAIGLTRQTNDASLRVLEGAGPAPYVSDLRGEDRTLAAYATYQFDVGNFTILPGVRAEDYWRKVSEAGTETEDEDVRVFPSLHVRRKLSATVNLDVSYTGRIDRPDFDDLSPVIRYSGDNASSGNPDLRPATTDAYEASFNYRRNKTAASFTFFDRTSHDVVGSRRDLIGGIVFTRPVNVGENQERGLEAQARGPLSQRWGYIIGANIRERLFNTLQSGAFEQRSAAQYSANLRLDYGDSNQEEVGADQLQFRADFQGPSYDLQSKQHALGTVNFTWRRRLSDRFVGTLNVNDVFASRKRTSEISTPDFYERSTRDSPGALARYTVSYQFGAAPNASQQQNIDNQPRIPGG
ncbi:MAG: TonB-dependent receptor [Alphaproteobacteria bacterium]|nr:MAG: TonB-dependent receptor [Caulobacteraceae bacterium]TPW07954.1 MAG: TonB-dependent receptor [Alphaproteobacteria bacterium]